MLVGRVIIGEIGNVFDVGVAMDSSRAVIAVHSTCEVRNIAGLHYIFLGCSLICLDLVYDMQASKRLFLFA